jgi:hypothetical protein
MTNEEIQRVMEFIIKQQETFAEGMTKAEERISRLETATVHLFSAAIDLNKAQTALTEKVLELVEAQAHTDQRVNVLIDILMQGRNGKSEDQT